METQVHRNKTKWQKYKYLRQKPMVKNVNMLDNSTWYINKTNTSIKTLLIFKVKVKWAFYN